MAKEKWSFKDWNVIEFLKGRKKLVVAIVGGALGYIITDSAVVATVSAGLVEMVFAVGEYYYKKQ